MAEAVEGEIHFNQGWLEFFLSISLLSFHFLLVLAAVLFCLVQFLFFYFRQHSLRSTSISVSRGCPVSPERIAVRPFPHSMSEKHGIWSSSRISPIYFPDWIFPSGSCTWISSRNLPPITSSTTCAQARSTLASFRPKFIQRIGNQEGLPLRLECLRCFLN